MKTLFFSAEGRINRARFWLATLALIVTFVVVVAVLAAAVAFGMQGASGDKNQSVAATVAGLVSLLYLALAFTMAWAGFCLGIKRFHDLDKSGAWVLIQFVPLVGPVWYLIEAGCIEGTRGPNRYGVDPLRPELGAGDPDALARRRDPQGRPGWVMPIMLVLALPGFALIGAGVVKGLHQSAWLKNAVHVQGTVTALVQTEVTRDGRATTSYKPVYEGTAPDGRPIKIKDFWALDPPPAIGSSVDLVYAPGQSDKVKVNNWLLWFLPAFLTGWGVIWAGFWVFCTLLMLVLWPRRRRPAAGTG